MLTCILRVEELGVFSSKYYAAAAVGVLGGLSYLSSNILVGKWLKECKSNGGKRDPSEQHIEEPRSRQNRLSEIDWAVMGWTLHKRGGRSVTERKLADEREGKRWREVHCNMGRHTV